MRIRWLTWLLSILFLTAAVSPGAKAESGSCSRSVRLMLVLDDSGSMSAEFEERNDPDNLRITAAHLLVDLLDDSDQVGLVLFSDQLREVSPLTSVGASRKELHERIDRFQSRGGTRLDTALDAALQSRPDAVLFLTDGRPDVDPAGQASRLGAMAASLAEQKISLYVIGLGPNYDRALLDQVVETAKSEALWHVTEPGHLSTAFLEILRNLKGLNIETVSGQGELEVPVLGLSPEVRFAALRQRGAAATTVNWSGGSLQDQTQGGGGAAYSYDILVYKPSQEGPSEAKVRAPVVWKIERSPVAARIVEPISRQELPAGEEVPVRIQLDPCGVARVPDGLQAELTVLDANRQPTAFKADLTADAQNPGALTGTLPMAPTPGTYVLSARILTREGQQVTVTEQTVTATPRSRWEISAPPTLATGASGPLTVRHLFGGAPAWPQAGAGPLTLTVTPPGEGARQLTLTPGAQPGTWSATVTAPPNQTGEMRYALEGVTASTRVEPVRFQITPPETLQWSFLGARRGDGHPFRLTGQTTGPVSSAAVIPPYEGVEHAPWAPSGAGFAADATAAAPHQPGWTSLRDLFLGRDMEVRISPVDGPYILADEAALPVRIKPLIAWYWFLLLLAAMTALGVWIRNRLTSGPQLRIAIGAGGSPAVSLMEKRPSWLIRLFSLKAQREITVGGPGSKAAVILSGMPAGALLQVKARGRAGRERFRIKNLNAKVPLARAGLRKSLLTFRPKDKPVPLSIGDLPLMVVLNPSRKRR